MQLGDVDDDDYENEMDKLVPCMPDTKKGVTPIKRWASVVHTHTQKLG